MESKALALEMESKTSALDLRQTGNWQTKVCTPSIPRQLTTRLVFTNTPFKKVHFLV
jgi:hypothetical protein